MPIAEPTIRTRRDLYDYLEEQMNTSYRQVLDSRRLDFETTYIKNYLLECDWGAAFGGPTPEQQALTDILTAPAQGPGPAVRPTVSETDEAGFYRVEWRLRDRHLVVYLDTISDAARRFWFGYSLSDARLLDLLLDRLIAGHAYLDRSWLWPELLAQMQSRGEFRGVGLDFDYRRFDAAAHQGDSTRYFKVQLWGGPETQQVLHDISDKFPEMTVLSKVRLKYWWDPDRRDEFSIEDLKYNGKFTVRGSSFGAHQALASKLRETYRDTISRIEAQHRIRVSADETGVAIDGDPVFFALQGPPIEDLDEFCAVVFSGSLPFRLWGMASQMPGNPWGRQVTCVDLHTGDRLFFEVYPDLICAYLDEDTCGNTVARFYTVLQHSFGRRVVAEANDGTEVF